MLRQEYPSSVLHHACFPAPSAPLIIDFLRKLAPDGAQTYSESRSYARRIYGNSGQCSLPEEGQLLPVYSPVSPDSWVQHYTAALRTATHLPAPATLPSYMIQMSGNLRISAPVLSKVVSASELYTDPKMEIWRGFQDSTRSSDCGVACLNTDRCEFCISSNPQANGRIRKRSPEFRNGSVI